MIRVLLLHGPNLNALGRRDCRHYGRITLEELERKVRQWGRELGLEVVAYQSNHEGTLIDEIQRWTDEARGAIVNFGALTHSSYALHDALVDFGHPAVEVHLSKISEREPWRRQSVIRPACCAHFEGHGAEGYKMALERLEQELGTNSHTHPDRP